MHPKGIALGLRPEQKHTLLAPPNEEKRKNEGVLFGRGTFVAPDVKVGY